MSSVFDTGEEKKREVLVSHLGEALGGERLLVGWHYVGGHLVSRHLVRRHLVRRNLVEDMALPGDISCEDTSWLHISCKDIVWGDFLCEDILCEDITFETRVKQFCKLIEKKCECEMSCECPR